MQQHRSATCVGFYVRKFYILISTKLVIMRASLSVLTCHHNHHDDNQFVGASKQTNLIDGLQYQFRIIKTIRYSHNAGSLTCCKKVQWPLMFSLALVNGRPMVNGDLREVSMTLYKGSNVECCPRGAAKVTEDNCVWHPQPTTTGDGGSHQNLSCRSTNTIPVTRVSNGWGEVQV